MSLKGGKKKGSGEGGYGFKRRVDTDPDFTIGGTPVAKKPKVYCRIQCSVLLLIASTSLVSLKRVLLQRYMAIHWSIHLIRWAWYTY